MMILTLYIGILFTLSLSYSGDASQPVAGFEMHANKRADVRARKRVNGVGSVEECAHICQTQTRFECTMFTVRVRGMRCILHSDQDAKSISSDLNQLLQATGFFAYIMQEQASEGDLATDGKECLAKGDQLGLKYRGTQSKTMNGKKCQRWDTESPHAPTFRPSNATAHENYCRNPDRDSGGAWCYTTDRRKRWEYCRVPNCKKPAVVAPPPTSECYVCNGNDYRGKLKSTINGKTCQRWDSSSPHQHTNHPSQKPGKNLVENYCRNPDGDIKPWCYTTDKSTRWEYCGASRCMNPNGSIKKPNARYTTNCVEGKGGNYRGTAARTKTGKTCAQWSSQFPHKHTRTPENYPCSGLDENYCRNPTGDYEEGTWCYTTDASTRWELCDVPKCGSNGRPMASTTTTTTSTTPTRSPPPGSCGLQAIQPSFMVQSFNIEDGRVAPSRSKRQAKNTGDDRILGGDVAVHGSWPWSVSVRYYDQHFCGGTLVDKRWVLTAAHCLDEIPSPTALSIKVGHHLGTEPQMQMRKVQRFIIHSGYVKKQVVNDIAMVRLTSPFDVTNFVRLACLPTPSYIVPGDSFCVVTGWGKTYDPKYKNELKQAVLPIHSYSDCLRYMGSVMRDKTQMCAGWRGQGHDTCRGDSGGPLVCLNNNQWTVQGVTSWGSGCESKKGNYGSYTRVSKYLDWIKQKLNS